MNLSDKHILLGLSGSIAAYKACDLVRRLRDAGAEVRVVMTEGATHFITPLTLQALSGHPVRTSLWDETAEAAMGHIELARWADAILIAPASANVIARLAAGQADDLLTTLCLATEAPLILAPAMNRVMWANPATQANVRTLTARGAILLGPAAGTQACGETGEGRMLEPLELVALLSRHLAPAQNRPWVGRRVVITAGPTREALDPVRFLSNRSSGRMGFALAEAAREAGAEVVLISGPTTLPTPKDVTRIDVETALQMRNAVIERMPCDIFIGTAAVADYRPVKVAAEKIKKGADRLTLHLVKNPDIISEVAARLDRPFVVGFAAETEHVLEHARDKLVRKRLDLIAANRVGEGLAFDQPDNALS
ncbi:MAG: bifunctional phosphopantothenoylcysteine decarboxylase/phosphopantothenate--cysteine ligase CoaBC, partial [Gammaproteobacteria bacterium]|nr:bifunctional phosphopantothenoylcysteine decarboxylase/phosphopantothenate--cysteine ligase CoaBC [Gammaproteobacteria bacterium]